MDRDAYATRGKKAPFKKGNPGRPKGSKNKLPRSVMQTMREICEKIISSENTTLRSALMRGVRSHPRFAFNYIRLLAEYNEGKPKETLDLNATFNEQVMEQAANGMRKKMDLLLKTVLKQQRKADDESLSDSGSESDSAAGAEAERDHTADGN